MHSSNGPTHTTHPIKLYCIENVVKSAIRSLTTLTKSFIKHFILLEQENLNSCFSVRNRQHGQLYVSHGDAKTLTQSTKTETQTEPVVDQLTDEKGADRLEDNPLYTHSQNTHNGVQS